MKREMQEKQAAKLIGMWAGASLGHCFTGWHHVAWQEGVKNVAKMRETAMLEKQASRSVCYSHTSDDKHAYNCNSDSYEACECI